VLERLFKKKKKRKHHHNGAAAVGHYVRKRDSNKRTVSKEGNSECVLQLS